MEDLTNITLDELLTDSVSYFLKDKLRGLRASNGHAILELRVQDGHVLTYSFKQTFKASNRERIRTRAK
jgi:hypothetical protein